MQIDPERRFSIETADDLQKSGFLLSISADGTTKRLSSTFEAGEFSEKDMRAIAKLWELADSLTLLISTHLESDTTAWQKLIMSLGVVGLVRMAATDEIIQ